MIIPVLGIPYFNRPDLLLRCVASIDVEVDRLVIVDQSPHGLTANWQAQLLDGGFAYRELQWIRHVNGGCAHAWNEIIKLYPAPWWLLVNNDIQFTPGDLDKMMRFVWQEVQQSEDGGRKTEAGNPNAFRLAACYGNHGASWWAVTAWGIGQVGLFDENFLAYLEDCDWSRRCDLMGLRRCDVPEKCGAIHGEPDMPGSCTVNSALDLRPRFAACHQAGFQYYEAKWGGKNDQETFEHPFNRPDVPLWAWKFDPTWRARLFNTMNG